MIAQTPTPPYYAVIFTSVRAEAKAAQYAATAERMVDLAAAQPGFLGVESARAGVGITVSYRASLDAIRAWKAHAEHLLAQQDGRALFYRHYKTRIARVERVERVERDYSFDGDSDGGFKAGWADPLRAM